MKRRLYFLLPNLDIARKIHDELLLARVEERNIHYHARPDLDVLDLTLRSGGILILAMALAGALVGAWSSSLVAVSVPNAQLKKFERALEQGQILLMVDVPRERVDEITDGIRRHHPEADAEGVEPTIPAFP